MKLRIASDLLDNLIARLTERVDVESAGLVLARRHGPAGAAVLVATDVAIFSDDAYLIRQIDQIRLDPIAINRLVRKARDQGLSIFTIHTHPHATLASFSWADDRGDARLLPSFGAQVPDVPHGSMVLATASGDLCARIWQDGDFDDGVELVSVGRGLHFFGATASASGADETFARQRLALGAHGQRTLAKARIGVVGLGGTGSVVAAQLAHLGVGELVLLDGDRVERSNLSRILGARNEDVGMPKVEVAARYNRLLDIGTIVDTHPIALVDAELSLLATCDVVLSCVDRQTPRALLNRFSYRTLVPVIDMGTAFRVNQDGRLTGDGGRVVVIGPGRPCLACWGVLDPERLRVEALDDASIASEVAAGYLEGANAPAPSVMPFNVMVAGAAVVEVLRLLTSFGEGQEDPDRLSFHFRDGTVRRSSVESDGTCRICGRKPGTQRAAA